MRASCSRACPYLSPMNSTGTYGCGFFRYSIMSDTAFLVLSAVEVSGMGHIYGKYSTVSAIIFSRVFTAQTL